MDVVSQRDTWELVDPLPNSDIVGSKWMFTIKYHANGLIERYKARLAAKGYTLTYEVDFFKAFYLVARLGSIRLSISLAVHHDWPLYQLDVKNAFLYGDLEECLYAATF